MKAASSELLQRLREIMEQSNTRVVETRRARRVAALATTRSAPLVTQDGRLRQTMPSAHLKDACLTGGSNFATQLEDACGWPNQNVLLALI